MLVLVLVLKELYDLSDTQTADALKFDIRWKVACGRSLLLMSFDPSTLVYWRKRIAKSARPDRVFDAVADVIAQRGILRGRRNRCVDSTVFDDAVATMDTVSQLTAPIRKVARVVDGAAQVIAAVCTLDYTKPGKPDIDWDDPQAKQNLVSDLVNDALRLLDALAGPGAPERDAVDRDARHTRKSKSKRRDGFFGDAGLPELRLAGLIEPAATALLDARAPGLDPALRHRLLAEAAGNPLALVELPKAVRPGLPAPRGLPPSLLPLTARLERAFASFEAEPDLAERAKEILSAELGH